MDAMIAELKAAGRQNEIEEKRQELNAQIKTTIPKDLAYVSGYLFDDYNQEAFRKRKVIHPETLNKLKGDKYG